MIKLLWNSIASKISEGIFKFIKVILLLSIIFIFLSLIKCKSLSRSCGAASIYPYLLLLLSLSLILFSLLYSRYSSIKGFSFSSGIILSISTSKFFLSQSLAPLVILVFTEVYGLNFLRALFTSLISLYEAFLSSSGLICNPMSFFVIFRCWGISEFLLNSLLNLTPKIFPCNIKVPIKGISFEINVLFLIALSIYNIIFCIIKAHSSFFIPIL